MSPILVFARLTVQEASCRRLLVALLILQLVVVGFSGWGFSKITTVTCSDGTVVPAQQVSLISSQLLIVITFMYSGVLALSAAVVAGPLISSEVESGLLLSMLARPVRRSEVVIGKWLGLAILVTIYAAGSALLELTAVNWATRYHPPQPVPRRASPANRLSRVGGRVVRADADFEHLELSPPRDLGPFHTFGVSGALGDNVMGAAGVRSV